MTEQYFQKYTVVCFFEHQEKSHSFESSDWPLHVTVLDTFSTRWQAYELSRALANVAASVANFEVVPHQSTLLGENKDVSVKLLQQVNYMAALHNKLLKLVDKGLIIFNTPAYIGNGFLPHVTDRKDNELKLGHAYLLDSISLIDMFPGKDYRQREVVDTFWFKC
jgi:hypothetical protein